MRIIWELVACEMDSEEPRSSGQAEEREESILGGQTYLPGTASLVQEIDSEYGGLNRVANTMLS